MSPASTAPGRILVVDDEEVIRRLIAQHLTGLGHACEQASDGRLGVAMASTGSFDVVLSDISMPGCDGLTLTREVRRTAPSTPVVLVTGNATFDHALRAIRHGACDFLLKPFNLDTLDQTVRRGLDRRRAMREQEDAVRVLEKRLEEQAIVHANAEQELMRLRSEVERLGKDLDLLRDAARPATV